MKSYKHALHYKSIAAGYNYCYARVRDPIDRKLKSTNVIVKNIDNRSRIKAARLPKTLSRTKIQIWRHDSLSIRSEI